MANENEKSAANPAANAIIQGALEGAERVNTARFADPARGDSRSVDGEMIPPGKWVSDEWGLPPDCPVEPLGYDKTRLFYLNARGTLSIMTARSFGQTDLEIMFGGRINYLFWAWPVRYKNKEATINTSRWQAEEARRVLIDAASFKGGWNPIDKMRGRGASLNEYGQLVYHAGDVVYVNGFDNPLPPGQIGAFLFPKNAAQPHPHPQKQDADMYNAARQVYEYVLTWNWARGDLDARFMVAWMACAMFGGALHWRPHVGITGSHGVGKSTLHMLIKLVMGDSLVTAADTTAAGIYQSLGHDTVGVLYDEAEASEDDRAIQAVVKLARISSSGGKALRGGAEHNHVEFVLRSCFMMSAINLPSMMPQDRSRWTELRLNRFETPGTLPDFTKVDLPQAGRKMLRRVMDHWEDYQRIYQFYRGALIKSLGMGSRAAEQYGTLVAMWHVLTSDQMPDNHDVAEWSKLLKPVVSHDLEDNIDNWEACLDHLLDSQVEIWRNKRERSLRSLLYEYFLPGPVGENDMAPSGLRARLSEIGCGLVQPNTRDTLEASLLFVPSRHPALSQLFERSPWKTGASARGVWMGALKQAPEGEVLGGQRKVKVTGKTQSGLTIKISTFLQYYNPST